MRRSRWVVFSILFALAVAGIGLGARIGWAAKDKGKSAGAEKSSGAPPGVTLNACGCYQKGSGCVCTNKKAKCECPGECEPVGCEEKRSKDLEKEYSDAVKKAQDDDKKRAEAETKKAQDEEKKRQAAQAEADKKRQAEEAEADKKAAGSEGGGDEGASAPADDDKPAKKKAARKDSKK